MKVTIGSFSFSASRIFCIANQKGGVGKTTTVVNLCSYLALAGDRVLIIDLDPQGNATSGLGLEKTPGGSSYGPLLGDGPLAEKIRPTAYERLQVVPSEVDLCGAELGLGGQRGSPGRQRLAAGRRRRGRGGRLEQRVELLRVDALHQVGVGADGMVAERTRGIGEVERWHAQEGLHLGGARGRLERDSLSTNTRYTS